MRPEELIAYLQNKLPNARNFSIANIRRLAGGTSRETWSFDASWEEDGKPVTQPFILRRDPDGGPVETRAEDEFDAYALLNQAGFAVPKAFWLELDTRWLGRPFFLTGRIDGCETDPTRFLSDPRFAEVRPKFGRNFVKFLADLHTLDWSKYEGRFFNPPAPEEAARREVVQWEKKLDEVQLEPSPVFRSAFQWLKEHMPPPAQRISMLHGDYRIGNILYRTDPPDGEIVGFLDWELVHLGDPYDDLGWTFMKSWRFGVGEGVDGLLPADEFIRLYQEYSGLKVDPEVIRWWEVLNNLKAGIILLTGGYNFCQGKTSNPVMAMMGRGAERFGQDALERMGVLGGVA